MCVYNRIRLLFSGLSCRLQGRVSRDVHTCNDSRSRRYLYNTTHNIIIVLARRLQRSNHRITRYTMTKPISTLLYGAGIYEHII